MHESLFYQPIRSHTVYMNQWYLLVKTKNITEANILQGLLTENQIPVQLLNKMDSSYLNFGEVDVYVPKNLKDVANNVVNNSLLNWVMGGLEAVGLRMC